MSKTTIQINFSYSMSKAELEAVNNQAAKPIAQVEGLLWKIFLIDEAKKRAGGLYLFENISAAQAYVDGPIIGGLRSHPAVSNVSVIYSGIFEDPSRITRAPIEIEVAEGAAVA